MIETITEALLYSAQKSRIGYRPVVEHYCGKEQRWREVYDSCPTRDEALDLASIRCASHRPPLYAVARTSLNGKRLRRRGSFDIWLPSLSAA